MFCFILVLLSEKVEERESRLYHQKLQQQMEKLHSQIQNELYSDRKTKRMKCHKKLSNEEFQSILSPEKLIELTEDHPDLQVSIMLCCPYMH